jgi:arabinofuranosyltransferase
MGMRDSPEAGVGFAGKLDKSAMHVALLALALTVLLRTAWMCDDAEITLRCVMNFLHGYGATFNADERVQAFTHPLWFAAIAAATPIFGNIFAATFTLSIVLSLGTWWLLLSRIATNFWSGMLAGAALLLSKAYVDYSTSGLESPLSHFLLICGLLSGFRYLENHDKRLATLSLTLLSSIYLCRPDLVLLVAPFCLLLLVHAYEDFRTTARLVAIAAMPALLWTIFSVFYYGVPFPNTAYAKLGTGIPPGELIQQGFVYLFDSISRDPVTLTLVAIGLMLALRQGAELKAIGAGIILYLVYVVSIGGDFMSGRFLTVPLLAACVIVSRTQLAGFAIVSLATVVAALGTVSLNSIILSGPTYSDRSIPANGITDERGFMFFGRGLLNAKRNTPDVVLQPDWSPRPKSVTVQVLCGWLGTNSLGNPPEVHFIDPCALTDPLLARLPAKYDPGWRIGHFERQIPAGYEDSIREGKNLLKDPLTRDYWEVIRNATRGPLFSIERFKAIARLNLRLVRKPDYDMYRTGDAVHR